MPMASGLGPVAWRKRELGTLPFSRKGTIRQLSCSTCTALPGRSDSTPMTRGRKVRIPQFPREHAVCARSGSSGFIGTGQGLQGTLGF